jgi:hypothetical protein
LALTPEEAQRLNSIWPHVAAQLPAAIRQAQALVLRPPDDLVRSLGTRYEMGEKLYNRNFAHWTEEQFDQEIACEIADVFLYLAMKRVMFGA